MQRSCDTPPKRVMIHRLRTAALDGKVLERTESWKGLELTGKGEVGERTRRTGDRLEVFKSFILSLKTLKL